VFERLKGEAVRDAIFLFGLRSALLRHRFSPLRLGLLAVCGGRAERSRLEAR
jgi:hypothetical protein